LYDRTSNTSLIVPDHPIPHAPHSNPILPGALVSQDPRRPHLRPVVRCHSHLRRAVPHAALQDVIIGLHRCRHGARWTEAAPDFVPQPRPLPWVHEHQVGWQRPHLCYLVLHPPVAPPRCGRAPRVAPGGDECWGVGLRLQPKVTSSVPASWCFGSMVFLCVQDLFVGRPLRAQVKEHRTGGLRRLKPKAVCRCRHHRRLEAATLPWACVGVSFDRQCNDYLL
jgi:hypothetical protein